MSWESWREGREEDYHPNFKWRGPLCLKRAKGLCAFCGIPNSTKRKNGSVVMLSACHLDHDPLNARARLAALCQSCHNRWDTENRVRNQQITYYQGQAQEEIGNGQSTINFKLKGNQDKLRQKNRRELFVDTDWRIRNLARKSEDIPDSSLKAEQLSMFAEIEETNELLPCIQVDFPVTSFLQSVPLVQERGIQ